MSRPDAGLWLDVPDHKDKDESGLSDDHTRSLMQEGHAGQVRIPENLNDPEQGEIRVPTRTRNVPRSFRWKKTRPERTRKPPAGGTDG